MRREFYSRGQPKQLYLILTLLGYAEKIIPTLPSRILRRNVHGRTRRHHLHPSATRLVLQPVFICCVVSFIDIDHFQPMRKRTVRDTDY